MARCEKAMGVLKKKNQKERKPDNYEHCWGKKVE